MDIQWMAIVDKLMIIIIKVRKYHQISQSLQIKK